MKFMLDEKIECLKVVFREYFSDLIKIHPIIIKALKFRFSITLAY